MTLRDRSAEPHHIAAPEAHLPKAASPRPVPEGAPLDHPTLYFNRELGDIDFNGRVLWQAMDERNPLLERVRYLAIVASNLDEFFQKRVGGLLRQQAAGVVETSPDGRLPEEQLHLIRRSTRALQSQMHELWTRRLRSDLADIGVEVVEVEDLTPAERERAQAHFESNIYPIVTPLAVDSGRPFPLISNLSLSLAVTLEPVHPGRDLFVRLKVPQTLGRWFEVGPGRYLPVEQLLRDNVRAFFPGMNVRGAWLFRVTRNADIRFNEEEAEDLIALIGEELRERRFAPVVRLEVEEAMPAEIRDYLATNLKVTEDDLVAVQGQLGLEGVAFFAGLDIPEHTFEPWWGITAKRIAEHYEEHENANMFALLRDEDVLVHHPYDLFSTSVLRFIEEAALDPDVLAIKQTLYRTSDDSPIVAALMRAAENGKQVAVLVEVKARFDEQNNIEWGERLEAAGVHVSYGFVGLKIHTKILLVVRREEDGIRTYCHIATGNYNAKTAQLYTDIGLFTADPAVGADLVDLFHHITGYAPDQEYESLLVAPWQMRDRFLALIGREIDIQASGGEGRIIAKMNGLDDVPVIRELYRASQAGVSIDLIVRGHSRLRPRLPGYSDNIRITSIIGRFLEHDRIFLFGNGGDPEVYIGSADWKRRNLSDRIEAVIPVTDPALRGRLINILELALDDNRSAWDLHADGRYVQRRPGSGEEERGLQHVLARSAGRLRR